MDDVEVTLEAVVLAVTSPVALPIFNVVELRLAANVLSIEPVTPMVEAVNVAVPGCPPSPTRILQGILTAISPSPAQAADDGEKK